MPSVRGWLELSHPYMEKYGYVRALKIGYAIRRARWAGTDNELVPVRLPELRAPLYLRAGTSDPFIFKQVFVHGDQSLVLSESPKTIVDLGANIGLTSVRFTCLYPEARIVAVEPDASNFETLQRNIAAYPQIEAIRCGIWNHDGCIKIANPDDPRCGFRVIDADADEEDAIAALTMQSLMRKFSIQHIDLLKIDIEGAEVELLDSGADSWLDSVGVMMVELHERFRPGCEAAFDATTKLANNVYQHGEFSVAHFRP